MIATSGVVGAGPVVDEVVGQPGDTFDVEVVGGLIEEQDIGVVDEELGQGEAAALATGLASHGRLEPTESGGIQPAEQTGEDVADARVARPDVLLEVAEHDLTHGRRGVERVVLGQDPDGAAAEPGDPAAVHGELTREDPQQRRLAATVASDDADEVAAGDPEGDPVEHLSGAEREGSALDRDDDRH